MPEPAPGQPLPDGGYDIHGEHARGGLGRILKAEDRRLGRIVAIKELLRQGTEESRRFLREVQLTARLQHPGIVPIYEAGRSQNGAPFYAMKFIEGRTLKEVLRDGATLDERLALLPKLITIAETIAYVHSENVIHRDLKPANVLIGRFGETVIVDWGLAKQLDAPEAAPSTGVYRELAADRTQEGAVIGTPAYMPVEQARGEPATTRSDVYAIGGILYELLTGAPPYRGTTSAAVLRSVLSGPPPSLHERAPGAPPALVAIAEKAMARDPQHRYADAGELAADLVRFQTGQLVRAHVYSRRELVGRWIARNRRAVAVALVALLTMSALLVVGVSRIVHERDRAETRGDDLLLAQAEAQLDRDPTAAVAWAKLYPARGANDARLRAIVADAESRGVARHVFRRDSSLLSVAAFSHDGTRVASEAERATLRISDVTTGRTLREIHHGGTAVAIAWTDDDAALVVTNWVTGAEAPIERIHVADGAITRLGATSRNVFALDLHGDAAVLSAHSGTVEVVDLRARTQQTIFKHVGHVSEAHFARDGSRIVSGGVDGVVAVYERATGRTATFTTGNPILALSLASDGRSALLGHADGSVAVLDLATGAQRVLGRHEGRVTSAVASSDGVHFATTSEDRTVRVWNVADGTSQLFAGNSAGVYAAAFVPGTSLVASGGRDGHVYVWNRETGEATVLRGHTAAVQNVDSSPDGRFLLTTAEDKTSRVWRVAPLAASAEIKTGNHRVLALAYSRAGDLVASSSYDGMVRTWTPSGAPVAAEKVPVGANMLAFAPDGVEVAASVGTEIVILDGRRGVERTRLHTTPPSRVWQMAYAADGRFAAAFADGTVRVWSADGTMRTLVAGRGVLRTVAISPDGRTIAAGGDGGTVYRWDGDATTARTDQHHDANVTEVAFSPDGRWLASVSRDKKLVLRDLRSGAVRVHTAGAKLTRIAFSASSGSVAVAGDDGVLLVYSLRGAGTQRFDSGDVVPVSVAFSRDERWLASVAQDGTARVWSLRFGDLRRMFRTPNAIEEAVVSADGATVWAACQDGVLRRWPMPTDGDALPTRSRRLDELTSATLDEATRTLRTR